MSERIEIKDDGYSVVIKPQGKGQVRLFVNDTDSTTQKTIAAIRQLLADIDRLRAELSGIKSAPVVAYCMASHDDPNYKWIVSTAAKCADIPPQGTELIARPTK